MFGAPEREDLIERLRDWLVQTGEEVEQSGFNGLERDLADEPADPVPQRLVGLLQVVEGFTALRHDVKLQTKSARQLNELVGQAVHRLDAAALQLKEAESLADQRVDETVRPLIERLTEVEELVSGALESASRAVADERHRWASSLTEEIDAQLEQMPRWRKALAGRCYGQVRELVEARAGGQPQENSSFQAVADGFSMVLSRLRKSLEAVRIERIHCSGMTFDPECMRAVEVVDGSGLESETVVAELRPGYRYRGKVFRSAEVRVARPPAQDGECQSLDKE